LLGSVRFRVTALATLAVLAVLVATSIGLVAAERRSLSDDVGETIGQRADELAGLVATNQLPPVLADDEDTRAGGDPGWPGAVGHAQPAARHRDQPAATPRTPSGPAHGPPAARR
jgi:hypothetical protein